MPTRMPFLLLLVIVPAVVVAGTTAVTNAIDESPLVARAGDGEGGFAVNAFLPENMTVPAGTTVHWEFPWWEPHTVSLGLPESGAPQAIPSGSEYGGTGFHTSELLFGPNKSYEIRFVTAGQYEVYCIIHPGMVGTVTVVDDATLGDTQAELDARADLDYTRELAQLKQIAATWAARPIERTLSPDGTTEHTVYIAGETAKGDVQQFFPALLRVERGDTVKWHSVTVTGHTVTFGPFPEGLPRPGNPLVDEISKPADAYTGGGYWNSGVIGIDWQAGHEFEMKFEAAGSFSYYCIPHIDQGMAGTIIVSERAASPTPQPPATGTGASPSGSSTHKVLLVVALSGALAAAALIRVTMTK